MGPDLRGPDLRGPDLRGPDLRGPALQAREAGDHPAAVLHWRKLLERAPDDWTLALELKQDTRAAGQYPDNDPQFRRAARRLPDGEWLQHYANLYAFHADDLAAIDARAAVSLIRCDDARLHAIRGDVARQRRDWPAAAQAFAAAAARDPAQPDYAHHAAAARLYARLASSLAATPWPQEGPATRIAVVNLDRNPERMLEMTRQLTRTPIPWIRRAAVEGARLPNIAAHRLTGDPRAPRGTLGCFLSHVAVWESWLAKAPAATEALLVIEDDAIPLMGLPPHLGGLNLPDAWDLVWVNDRMEKRQDPDTTSSFTAHPLPAVMQAMHPHNNACGTDGYLISPSGAAKLLAWVAEDGMAHDIDWRLVAYAMTPPDLAAMPSGHARRVLEPMVAAIPRPDRLAAYTLYPALIRTVGVSSDREDQNRGSQT